MVTSPIMSVEPAMSPSLAAVFDVFGDGVLATTVSGCRIYSNASLDAIVGNDARLPQHTPAPPPYVPPDQFLAYRDLLASLRDVVGADTAYSGGLEIVNRCDGRRTRVAVTVGALVEPGRPALALWLVRALTANGSHPAGGGRPGELAVAHGVVRGIDRLTRREVEVLGLLLDGWRVASIARSLYVSEHTVRNHLKAIYRKLSAHSQQELIERLKSPGRG
jgi:DNA-binding CsgD family transcriptional regulator